MSRIDLDASRAATERDLSRLNDGQRQILEEIQERLNQYGSHKRASPLVAELEGIGDPTLFWFLLQDRWPSVDNAWEASFDLLRAIKRVPPLRPEWTHEANAAFYDSLPDCITVYRGCSASRVRGVAWTTDRKVAEGFADGHRGIRTPNSVIATATLRKASKLLLFCCADRQESEVFINSRHSTFRPTVETWLGSQLDA